MGRVHRLSIVGRRSSFVPKLRTGALAHRQKMGLLHILKKLKHKEKEMRVLMLGLDNAGKSTVVYKFSGKDITELCPTLGFQICTLDYRGYALNVWDVGGQ